LRPLKEESLRVAKKQKEYVRPQIVLKSYAAPFQQKLPQFPEKQPK